jgi:methionyl-tRNA formyltransferase
LKGEVIKVWRAEAAAGSGAPGTVLAVEASGIVVACGTGALRLTELQKPGGRRLPAADFLRGSPVAVGAVLQTA